MLTGATFSSRRSAASERPERVAVGHRGERVARGELDAAGGIVDEHAAATAQVQRRRRRPGAQQHALGGEDVDEMSAARVSTSCSSASLSP